MPATDLADGLRDFGLTYPDAGLKSPWPEHLDLAVRDKTFAFLPAPGRPFRMTVKLPYSGPEVLELPFAKPAGYGLGRSGWVALDPAPGEAPPLATLRSWIDESYRAVAPKTLIKRIAGAS